MESEQALRKQARVQYMFNVSILPQIHHPAVKLRLNISYNLAQYSCSFPLDSLKQYIFFRFVLPMTRAHRRADLWHLAVQSAEMSYTTRGLTVAGDDPIYIPMLWAQRLPQWYSAEVSHHGNSCWTAEALQALWGCKSRLCFQKGHTDSSIRPSGWSLQHWALTQNTQVTFTLPTELD